MAIPGHEITMYYSLDYLLQQQHELGRVKHLESHHNTATAHPAKFYQVLVTTCGGQAEPTNPFPSLKLWSASITTNPHLCLLPCLASFLAARDHFLASASAFHIRWDMSCRQGNPLSTAFGNNPYRSRYRWYVCTRPTSRGTISMKTILSPAELSNSFSQPYCKDISMWR